MHDTRVSAGENVFHNDTEILRVLRNFQVTSVRTVQHSGIAWDINNMLDMILILSADFVKYKGA